MLAVAATLPFSVAQAQLPSWTPSTGDIIVTGKFEALHLDDQAEAGSRLGLSLREIPASVEVLTQDQLQLRGLRTAREAFSDITGAIAGNVPGNPATVTLRGFSGNAVTVLFDGVRAGSSTIVARDIDMWNYERVEAIKGPASVLDGEGALAGAINLVTKKPTLGRRFGDILASYGSFGTGRIAGDVNLPLSDTVAVLASASYLRSASLYDIDDNHYRSLTGTASLLWRPTDRLTASFAFDYSYDRSSATYQGSPLVPAGFARDPSRVVSSANGLVVDAATRHVNYNPLGGYQDARSETVRSRIDYDLGDGWSLTNDVQFYHAKRAYLYSNSQAYQATTARLARDVREIFNDQDFVDDRATIGHDGALFGLRNRVTLGVEYNHTNFDDPRRFGTLTAVDPFAPVRSALPSSDPVNFPGAGNAVLFRTQLNQTAVFAEDALNLTPSLLLVGGLRWEEIDLRRSVYDYALQTTTRTAPEFKPMSGRIGAVYSITPAVQVYAQYSTAVVPVGTLLVLTTASGAFDLSTGRTYEVGFKSSLLRDRVSLTGAAYQIGLDHILTIDPTTNLSVQGGSQSSRGVEATLGADLLHNLHLDAGAAYSDAHFDTLIEAGGANRAGKTPPNTPSTVINGALLYSVTRLPVTLGAFVKHVSHFYTDNANSYDVRGHTTLDASIAYRLPSGTVTLRGRNLTNALYGEYSGYPATQIYLGAPRSMEVSYAARF
ncbi:TonB-dependent siderophore receptor [Sphingomonas nostoxanthinifaciens]|nr:TonB-dependent siderophore receptor [Sphingomonas nostoxanthinifaciens]